MKKLKELMKGYKTRIFGDYIVIKEIAHRFDKDMNEKYYYMYIIERR